MATLRKPKALIIGLIAEDDSDIDVATVILNKYAERSKFSIQKFVGNGCGKLRNKCASWAKNLINSGCRYIIVLHDADRLGEEKVRKTLVEKLSPKRFPNAIIVIPVEELEAWLLCEPEAIRATFNLKEMPKTYKNCEAVNSPKEELCRIIYSASRKRYLNTVHNKRIAEKIQLASLRKCSSFQPLDKFILNKIFPEPAS